MPGHVDSSEAALNLVLVVLVPLVVIIVTVGLMRRLYTDVKRGAVHQLESIYQSDGSQQKDEPPKIKQPKTTLLPATKRKVKDALQQLEQQHTTSATDKGATATSSKPGSGRSPTRFFVKKGDTVSWLSSSQLKAAVANGELSPDDLIRKSEKDNWTKLSTVKGLDF